MRHRVEERRLFRVSAPDVRMNRRWLREADGNIKTSDGAMILRHV